MYDEIDMPEDIVAFAEQLVAKEEDSLFFIKTYDWQDEEEAHDDDFQEEMHDEFCELYDSIVEQLSPRFGEAAEASGPDEFEEIQVNEAYPAAVWSLNEGTLYLAVSHEDRELPMLLAIGMTRKQ